MGRMYTTILAKLLGISFFLLLILLYMNNAGIWYVDHFSQYCGSEEMFMTRLILPSYIIRTSFMNSTKVCLFIICDVVTATNLLTVATNDKCDYGYDTGILSYLHSLIIVLTLQCFIRPPNDCAGIHWSL